MSQDTDPVAACRISSQPTFEQKVRFLGLPANYPENPPAVLVKETHMSMVFLGGDRVYKLKKPIHLPFLDFRTLAARERNCREEVRLNRRLAPQTYLGVVPLTLTAEGSLALGQGTVVVDWLVVMRRLPEELMLDRVLGRGRVHAAQLTQLADVLANFYRKAERPSVPPEDYLGGFARQHDENRRVLTSRRFAIDPQRISKVLEGFEQHLAATGPLLRDRAGGGHVLEGHGDLRPEHICLTDPIVIFDCLEFDPKLRLVDPCDELEFLAMECAILDHATVGRRLRRLVATRLGEAPPVALIRFYAAFRALLRARLSLAHLLDSAPRDPAKWEPLADRYLAYAEQALSPSGRARQRSR